MQSVRIDNATRAAHDDWHCDTYFEFRIHSGNPLLQIGSCSPHTRDQHLTHPVPLVEWHFLWVWAPVLTEQSLLSGRRQPNHSRGIIENGHSGRCEDVGSGPR